MAIKLWKESLNSDDKKNSPIPPKFGFKNDDKYIL